MSKQVLKLLVEAMIKQQFSSLQEADPPQPTEEPPADVPDSDDDFPAFDPGEEEEGGLDMGDDTTPVDSEDLESLEDDEEFADDEFDAGGMGGGLDIASGGGFGGSDSSDSTTQNSDGGADSEEHESVVKNDTHEPGESLMPADPTQEIIDLAIDMLDISSEPKYIENVVKGHIQHYFEDFSEATDVIQGLWETEHPVLRVVARKLILFIHGS